MTFRRRLACLLLAAAPVAYLPAQGTAPAGPGRPEP
jgi:hypothetical protein